MFIIMLKLIFSILIFIYQIFTYNNSCIYFAFNGKFV